MKHVLGRAEESSILQTANFTGEVRADTILSGEPDIASHHVFFAPSARTFWHVHELGQLLFITAGAGVVVSRRTAVQVRAGDAVWTEPGEEHWHGAVPNSFLVHTTVSLGGHVWLAEVGDDEYAAAVGRA